MLLLFAFSNLFSPLFNCRVEIQRFHLHQLQHKLLLNLQVLDTVLFRYLLHHFLFSGSLTLPTTFHLAPIFPHFLWPQMHNNFWDPVGHLSRLQQEMHFYHHHHQSRGLNSLFRRGSQELALKIFPDLEFHLATIHTALVRLRLLEILLAVKKLCHLG